jgi:hypothetical protein
MSDDGMTRWVLDNGIEVMPVLTEDEADILGRAYFDGDSDALDDVEPIIKRLLDAAEGKTRA